MLYLSTRNQADSFTAHRALLNTRTTDGGMFIPMQFQRFSERDLMRMKDMTFGEAVALVLNLFFDKKIDGRDVDLQVGRSPYRIITCNHRLIIAQLLESAVSEKAHFEKTVYKMIGGVVTSGESLPVWPKIAIRIAVLFAVYRELHSSGTLDFDVAVCADDFSAVIAAWYAIKMGLPAGKIICGCDEGSGIWDLINRGEFAIGSTTAELEMLIFDAFGRKETARYLDACNHGNIFKITDEQRDLLQSQMFVAVSGQQRVKSIIKSVVNNTDSVLDAPAATAYCALQDYRHKTGESIATLILM